MPEVLFSHDMFHPSAAGYALAAKQLFPALCNALGDWIGGAVPELPWQTQPSEGTTLVARVGSLSRLWRRSTGVPAPIVARAG